MFSYIVLKLKALFLRAGIQTLRFFTYADWKRAYFTATSEYTIPSSKTNRAILIRKWAAPDESAGVRPVHVNMHGSGFVFSSMGEDSDFCQLLSQRLNITVLDCDYAKTPEHPFPAAYYDVEDIIAHVLSSSSLYDLSNFTMGGFSAGGALSITTSACSPLAQPYKVKALVAIYPHTDMSSLPPPLPNKKIRKGSTGLTLSLWMTRILVACSVRNGVSPKDPRMSPKYVDINALPRKVCLVRAECDELRQQGDEFEVMLKDGGVDVSGLVVKDVAHVFDKRARPGTWEHERKEETYEFALKFLERVYASA